MLPCQLHQRFVQFFGNTPLPIVFASLCFQFAPLPEFGLGLGVGSHWR